VLGEHVARDSMAREALPDGEAGIARTARVGAIDLPPVGALGDHAVVAVVHRREERPPVAVHVRPLHAVAQMVANGEVLDRHAVGFDHVDADRAFEPTIDHHPVPVEAADRDEGRRDEHRFAVDTGCDEHHAAGLDRIRGFLDRRRVVGNPHRLGETARHRFPARADLGGQGTRQRRRERDQGSGERERERAAAGHRPER
jgi:hypothetical protein